MDFTLYDPHVERWTSLAIGFSQMRLRVGGLQPLMVQRSFQPLTSCIRNSTRTLPGYTDNGINDLFAHPGRHAASRIHRWHPQLCCKSYHSSVSVVLNPRYPIWLGPCYNTDIDTATGAAYNAASLYLHPKAFDRISQMIAQKFRVYSAHVVLRARW